MSRPAVFLDRDGTVIVDVPYLGDPDLVRLLPGAAVSIKRLRDAGFACVVVSNQSAIGRGKITLEQLHRVNAEMLRQLAEAQTTLDGIYWSTHAPLIPDKTVIEHVDRKPGPGMLLRAAEALDLDLARSWMLGDQTGDMLASRNAGCRGGILVRTGHDVAPALAILGQAWPIANDLQAALAMILEQ